ncbi:MAG: replication initiation protein [Alphaproteobacteria bacterium]|nr:replication initiation protein [Alphaproteobacteria bacterium]
MKCKYSIRLYEILKAKIKNGSRLEWYYSLENLKEILECTSYKRYPDFTAAIQKRARPAKIGLGSYSVGGMTYFPHTYYNIF